MRKQVKVTIMQIGIGIIIVSVVIFSMVNDRNGKFRLYRLNVQHKTELRKGLI